MAAYEVLLLNTAIPQIQAAQSGDTYVVPRDIAINATATITGNLGIGITNPTAKLVVENGHVNMTTDYGVRWRAASAGAYNGALLFDSGNNLIVQTGSALTERMRVSSGEIRGVGTGFFYSGYRADGTTRQFYLGGSDSAFYVNVDANVPIYIANNNTTRVTVDTSGNLGVGTTNPVAKLSVAGDILAPSFNTNTTYTIGIQDAQTNAFVNTNRGNLQIQASSAKPGANGMGGGNLTLKAGTSDIGGAGYDGNVSIVAGYNTLSSALSSGVITFTTNNTERARITSAGDFLVGTTSAVGKVTINDGALAFSGNATAPATNVGIYRGGSADNLLFSTGGVERMQIASGGDVNIGNSGTGTRILKIQTNTSGDPTLNLTAAGVDLGSFWFERSTSRLYARSSNTGGVYLAAGGTSWTAVSDERKKDIIEPITDAASKVSTLRAVIGKYKTDEDGKRRSFLIAQDVQAVLPEAVDATNSDELGLSYSDMIPLLVAAIKEQQAMINDLKAKVASLGA